MWQFIKSYAARYWLLYSLGLIALLITNYIATVIPLKIKSAIDIINLAQPELAQLMDVLWLIIGLAIVLLLVRTSSRILIFFPGRFIEFRLRNDLYRHLLTLNHDFYHREKVGDLMSRLINDIQNLRLMSAMAVLHMANTTMIFGFVIFQMLRIDPNLTLWVLAPIPAIAMIVKILVNRMFKYVKLNQDILGEITDFFVEAISSITVIKSYGAEQKMKQRLSAKNEQFLNTNLRLAVIRSSMFSFIAVVGSLGQVILLLLAGTKIINGELSLGDLVAFSAYIALMAWPTAALAWIISVYQRGKVSLTRIQDIFQSTPSILDRKDVASLSLAKGPEITLKNLNFTYENATKSTIRNLNCSIPAGSITGIFGPAGSGKTTLANILARLEPISEGQYHLDKKDVHEWSLRSMRDCISYVPQNTFLFSDTITENIAYGNTQSENGHQNINTIATLACVEDDIARFPKRYETMVGEKGVVLSGGQKNRLSLARALYKTHHILILDDVLSAVDHDTEQRLIQNIFDKSPRPTTIIISHRISALTKCDQILVLEHGEITDQGHHDALIRKDGIYKDTWAYQKMMEAIDVN